MSDISGQDCTGLSKTNKKDLVGILVWLHHRYEHDKSPMVRRQIHAMKKTLELLGLHKDKTDSNDQEGK